MSNKDCENCAGYRCPCTCTSDCGKKQGVPCPKSEGYEKWLAEFTERSRSAGEPGHRQHDGDQGNADQAVEHGKDPS